MYHDNTEKLHRWMWRPVRGLEVPAVSFVFCILQHEQIGEAQMLGGGWEREEDARRPDRPREYCASAMGRAKRHCRVWQVFEGHDRQQGNMQNGFSHPDIQYLLLSTPLDDPHNKGGT